MAPRWEGAARWGPAGWYELALEGLNALARGQTRLLQSGYLRHYLLITLAATGGLAGYALVGRGAPAASLSWSDLRFYEAGLGVLILLAVLAAVLMESRLAAIAALSVVGYGVSLVFVLFGVPDLAMTQFLVETLTVILFVLVFYHLPESRIVSGMTARVRDAALAVALGAVMTALVLVATPENYPPISAYFAENSVTKGHGRNIVNVILVDFRGLDTLGEITVLRWPQSACSRCSGCAGWATARWRRSEPSSGPVAADTPRGQDAHEVREGDRRTSREESGAEPGARVCDSTSVAARGGEGP